VRADVADAAAVDAAADALASAFGRIDVWVNNAMASVFSLPSPRRRRRSTSGSQR
jgi:NAD(P)-dependent dehydrogenase (short-subunit alcohol dehydrogenase family)